LSSHLAHDVNRLETGTASVSPRLVFLHAEFGMPPARQ
jgi:hypothetical protein